VTTIAGDAYEAATHRYFLGGREVPGVTSVLKAAGIIDTKFLNNQEALRRGTQVHQHCEWVDREVKLAHAIAVAPIEKPIDGYVNAYAAFLRDHAPRYTHVEQGLLHGALRFGGRPDRICADLCGRGPAILEIKTGSPAPWHGVQLAAYQLLFPTGSRWVVYLRPDGRYHLQRVIGPDDYGRFLDALNDYHASRGREAAMP
jgi:hypothetical protein